MINGEDNRTTSITLTNGKEVSINTKLSLAAIKRARNEGLISANLIQDMMKMDKDPMKADFGDMENAPYLAYRNANPGGMSRTEFEEVLPHDLELFGNVYGEIVGGEIKKVQMAQNFKNATKQKKNRKRKSQK